MSLERLSAEKGNSDQGTALLRLREAYIDLEATRPLRELGASAAFINHEIKNYMMVISGYAMLLQRSKNLGERDREMVGNIADAAAKLQEFSMSVIEASKASGDPRGVQEVDLNALLRDCVTADFPERSSDIIIECAMPQSEVFVCANPEKLSRVFACALCNSFEAGANRVNIRVSVHNYIALITIDDDGKGCEPSEFPNLSKTFYTTKSGADGMGLGLCAMRSIVESHGGHISIYSKNLLGGGDHGMTVQIMIPASKRVSFPSSKSEAVLVRGGLNNIPAILNILKRLKIIPRMADSAKDAAAAKAGTSLDTVVFAAPQQSAELMASLAGVGGQVKVLTIEESESGVIFAADAARDIRSLFTEEYVVRHFME